MSSKKMAIAMFGQKRLSREGGIEIVSQRALHKNGRRMVIQLLVITDQDIM